MEGVLIKDQRVDEGRVVAEHGKLDYKDSSDDEEVKLLPHRKGADEPDPPVELGGATSSGTRADWGFGHISHRGI